MLALPLRVALDATPLSVSTGGIRRYTTELVRALAVRYPDDSYYLVSDQPFDLPDPAPNLHRGEYPATPLERRWWTLGLPRELRRLGVDVFHGTDFAVPYLPSRPAVMTLHDLTPWRASTAASTSRRVRTRTPLQLGLGLATMVLTPSEAMRREAISRFRLRADRVVAVPLAASERFRPVAPSGAGRPYFLCVGTFDPRKNLSVVVDAWTELRRQAEVDLRVVGRGAAGAIADGVTYVGEVPDEALPALYSGAVALLYPSLYEGFGLPVLEAMQCGTMVIASKDPAISEVAEGAAIQIDASDARGWLTAMKAALDSELRSVWRERGLARAAQFSWERTAMMTREVYDEALRLF